MKMCVNLERFVFTKKMLEKAMNLPEDVTLLSIDKADAYSDQFVLSFATNVDFPKGQFNEFYYQTDDFSEVGDLFRNPEKYKKSSGQTYYCGKSS